MAMPTSACARAGASLMPSPTMARRAPPCCSAAIVRALPSGRTPAISRSMPTSRAIGCADASRSPVSITGSMPSPRSDAIAAALEPRAASRSRIEPRTRPSTATTAIVDASSSAPGTAMPAPAIHSGVPARARWPPMTPSTPCPGWATTSVAGFGRIPRSSAHPTMARASGCSLERSSDAATESTSRSVAPRCTTTPDTRGRPSVTVPVLSSTTVVTRASASSAAPPLTRMPRRAAAAVPAMIAAGVASPIAHGQAMMSVDTTATRARAQRSSTGPNSSHAVPVMPAITNTAGTKRALTRSASRAIGALLACAASTARTTCASTVAVPTFVATNRSAPAPLTVPPSTASPGALATGIGSPVSIDSSMLDRPDSTTPSTGTREPGRTRTRSPTATSDAPSSCSEPSRMTTARGGARSTSDSIARLADRVARHSSHFPSVTSTTIDAAASKCTGAPWTSSAPAPRARASSPGTDSTSIDQVHATPLPRATSVSIEVVPARAWRQARTMNGHPQMAIVAVPMSACVQSAHVPCSHATLPCVIAIATTGVAVIAPAIVRRLRSCPSASRAATAAARGSSSSPGRKA